MKHPMVTGLDESHWSVLSLLRFVLCFSVLLGHIDNNLTGLHKWFFGVGGTPAVAGFFLISGFSIAHSLTQRPRGYFKRRIMRIYPLSIAAVLVGSGIVYAFGGPAYTGMAKFETPPRIYIISMILLLNGVVTRTPPVLVPFWSLSSEVYYYLLAPIFSRLRMPVLIGLICFSVGFYVWYYPRYSIWFGLYGGSALAMMCFWLTGFMLYGKRVDIALLVLVAAVGCFLLEPLEQAPVSSLLLCFAVPVFAIGRFTSIAMPAPFTRMANYLGEISYPLYLFHFPVISVVDHYFTSGNIIPPLLIDLVCPLGMAIAAYHLIDVPIRKRRFHPQPL